MVPSTPNQQQGPGDGLGASLPGQTPQDILLIIFIHGYRVSSIHMTGCSLVTSPVSRAMTRHLETFLRDYDISSQKLFRIR